MKRNPLKLVFRLLTHAHGGYQVAGSHECINTFEERVNGKHFPDYLPNYAARVFAGVFSCQGAMECNPLAINCFMGVIYIKFG